MKRRYGFSTKAAWWLVCLAPLTVALVACNRGQDQPAQGQGQGQHKKTPEGGSTVKPGSAGGEVKRADPAGANIVFAVGTSDAEDPAAAGKAAAQEAKKQLGDAPLQAVIVTECFEDKDRKAKVLDGVHSVFDEAKVFGGSSYGTFAQSGVFTGEAVGVLAIAGKDIEVRPVTALHIGAAGPLNDETKARIEASLRKNGKTMGAAAKAIFDEDKEAPGKLLVVIADAHSPKNGALVKGIQETLGKDFPITGGSVNKNKGQSFVYAGGEMLTDAAVGLAISGKFTLAMSGRKAKDNDKVIATAKDGAAEAMKKLADAGAKPAAVLAYDCAGRKGKLDNVADELAAMQGPLGTKLPLFGTYNAGEIGPADTEDAAGDALSSGVGWHVMFTVIGW